MHSPLHKSSTKAGKTRQPTTRPPVPSALADVALIDGPTCAAGGQVSISQWLDLVRTGDAPQPAIREPRFTRWKLADVRAYWVERAARGSNPQIVAQVTAHATKASRKAAEKRAAAAAQTARGEE
jgi:hypothetical protein